MNDFITAMVTLILAVLVFIFGYAIGYRSAQNKYDSDAEFNYVMSRIRDIEKELPAYKDFYDDSSDWEVLGPEGWQAIPDGSVLRKREKDNGFN